jgi:hypothetical protein
MRQPPRPGDAIRELDIRGLQRLRGGPDTARALVAGRALEQIFVAVSFYAPREFIARGDPERALAMLDVAESIRSEHPQVLLFRARALAAAGRFEEARAAVDAALRAGVTRQTIEGDSLLGPLVRPRRVPGAPVGTEASIDAGRFASRSRRVCFSAAYTLCSRELLAASAASGRPPRLARRPR